MRVRGEWTFPWEVSNLIVKGVGQMSPEWVMAYHHIKAALFTDMVEWGLPVTFSSPSYGMRGLIIAFDAWPGSNGYWKRMQLDERINTDRQSPSRNWRINMALYAQEESDGPPTFLTSYSVGGMNYFAEEHPHLRVTTQSLHSGDLYTQIADHLAEIQWQQQEGRLP